MGYPPGRSLAFAAVLMASCAGAVLLAGAGPAAAHGVAGNRFFPATIATDDPFVADELALPTVSHRKDNDNAETDIVGSVTKTIFPNFGLSYTGTYRRQSPNAGGPTLHGFDDADVSAKYQFFKSDEHEIILSAGVDWSIGGTGASQVGATNYSAFTPTFFWGKGLGDLPDDMALLKPLAVTGILGLTIPTRSRNFEGVDDDGNRVFSQNSDVLNWGFAIQYSIPYLQSAVRDMGIGSPFNRLIPVVEFAFTTPIDRQAGKTQGTINPGIIWAGQKIQLALEAVIPVNNATGRNIGVLGQLHFYLDDIYPPFFGKPLSETLFGK